MISVGDLIPLYTGPNNPPRGSVVLFERLNVSNDGFCQEDGTYQYWLTIDGRVVFVYQFFCDDRLADQEYEEKLAAQQKEAAWRVYSLL